MSKQGMVSIEVPGYFFDDCTGVVLTEHMKGGFEAGHGFAPDMNAMGFFATCDRCHGESVVLWVKPKFCPYCGAEYVEAPKRETLECWNPFDVEQSWQMQGKAPHPFEDFNAVIREALSDFFGAALERNGSVVLPGKSE